ncbi:MAG: hypothetical protein HGA45_04215 [Chloroflexales bacterium]|nr:hypothetical protein [Chloroflexales bacterium]
MTTVVPLQFVLDQVQAGIRQFATGDPNPYKACWSLGDDVTICGGWGAYERGWEQVGPRLAWAAARWRGGHTAFELLAVGASGTLAYTIWIEHEAQVASGGLERVSREPVRLREIDLRAVEGQGALAEVDTANREPGDLTHAQPVIEQQAHKEYRVGPGAYQRTAPGR